MPSKNDLQQRAAETLVRPFSKGRGRGSAPLSYRILPEGGMVVITAEGRKLWFSADELAAAMNEVSAERSAKSPQTAKSRFTPSGLLQRQEAPVAYNGMPTLIVLPPDRKKKPSNGETL